jgi:ribonucleoside-diphosphate reductase alpha chain
MEETLKASQLPFPKEIEAMFSFESKLSKRVPAQFLERYKKLYKTLREMIIKGELPLHSDYLSGNELAISIYKKKYFLKDTEGNLIEHRPEDVFLRLASFLAAVESDEKALEWAKRFYLELYEGLWLPGGRIIAGAGDLYRLKTLANCFVSQIENDDIESIYKAAYEAARTYSYGGGIGIDITTLRPADSIVHNAANVSTGAVSFMELYSLTTGLIGQSGRRGALMLMIHVKHPDVERFIKVKQEPNWVTNQIINQISWTTNLPSETLEKIKKAVMENTQVRFANISIKITDEFMHAVLEQNMYGNNYLVYKKFEKGKIMDMKQSSNYHYSDRMPSKDLNKYELLFQARNLQELNEFLSDYGHVISEEELKDPYKRDVYGDYVIETDKEFDLAIRKAGDFLLFFSSEQTGIIKRLVNARKIWNMFIEGNYKTAEPGLVFWDVMKAYSPSDYIGKPIVCTNPCAEVPLEDGGACNLGSINLSTFVLNPFTEKAKIDWKKLEKAVETLQRAIDNAIEWNIYLNPLEKQRDAAKELRRQGIGVMGIADMLNQLGIAYDSDEGISILEEVMKRIANIAYQSSAKLANEKGSLEIFDYEKYSMNPFFKQALTEETKKLIKKYGLRNIALLSIAPTGTISNAVKSFELRGKNYIGVSGGIEPVFAIYYTRRTESMGEKVFRVFHSTIQAYLDMKGLSDLAQESSEEELRKILPAYMLRTAHVIDPEKRVKIQAIAQKYIDHSISSTVNLPEDIDPEVISDIYINAWKNGLKGITIYREGSRYPILSTIGKRTEFQEFKDKKFKIVVDGKEYVVKGDEIIVLPSGKLTTVYHGIKKGILKEVLS